MQQYFLKLQINWCVNILDQRKDYSTRYKSNIKREIPRYRDPEKNCQKLQSGTKKNQDASSPFLVGFGFKCSCWTKTQMEYTMGQDKGAECWN